MVWSPNVKAVPVSKFKDCLKVRQCFDILDIGRFRPEGLFLIAPLDSQTFVYKKDSRRNRSGKLEK